MSDKRLAVLVFMDPEKAEEFRGAVGCWHLSALATPEDIQSGAVARQFANALPGVCDTRAERGQGL